MTATGLIFNILKFCVHDGPGIRTTVFLKGCPLNCWWCHNPEGLSRDRNLSYRSDLCIACGDCYLACSNGAVEAVYGGFEQVWEACRSCGCCADACFTGAREIIGREITVEEVLEEVRKDKVFYEESGGGVTFSGGEPLMQPDFLYHTIRACHEAGIHTAVETSGYVPWEDVERIVEYTDLFLYDLKTIDEEVHRTYTGVSNVPILKNLERLASVHNELVVRIPLIPGVNDREADREGFSRFIASLKNVKEVNLLPFHIAGSHKCDRIGVTCRMTGDLTGNLTDNLKLAGEFADRLSRYGVTAAVGG